MQQSRTHRSIHNVKWGLVLQAVSMISSFAMRTIFVWTLGIGANGLNSLFDEVISVMSLAEMGVGTAIVYSLYAPLAQNDTQAVKRLMGLYKTAYRIIGIGMMAVGLALTPFIHHIVNGTGYELSYIRLVFVLFTVQSASSYFFSYKRSIFHADQKNSAVSICLIGVMILRCVASIAVLALTRRYIPYLITQIVVTLAGNVAFSVYADRAYPYLREKACPALPQEKAQVRHSVKNLFIGALSGKITNSTDNILISVLVSTYQIGVYANYSLITHSLLRVFERMGEAISGSLGNLVATGDEGQIRVTLGRLEFLFGAAGFLIVLPMYAVITPFVQLWVGEGYVIDAWVLFVCMVNEFLFFARCPLWHAAVASGLFVVDKYVSLLGSAINLVVSIVLGSIWGMLGIFLGTSCTLVIQIVLKEWLLHKRKLNASARHALVGWGVRCALMLVGLAIVTVLNAQIHLESRVAEMLVRGGTAFVLGALMLLCVYARSAEFVYAKGLARRVLRER